MPKNDLLLKALLGQKVERPPVWMMRQAGRYLPSFRKLKEQYDFFDRVRNPEMACEITMMPIHQVGVDAAILFSDILVIPQAMGIEVKMVESKGPVVPNPIRTREQIDVLVTDDMANRLDYVMKAIKLTLNELNGSHPLIGFAGAPWTIFCYVIQGGSSKSFDTALDFVRQQPVLTHQLLNKITGATISYLHAKIDAGVHAIQLFDSWAGLLDQEEYMACSHHYNKRIINSLNTRVPVILFAKDRGDELDVLIDSGAAAMGIDWNIYPEAARRLTQNTITLQGNLDPSVLLEDEEVVREETLKMINRFGTQRYIANLGHGILPETPVENAIAFVETVKGFEVGKN
ncbi:MAG TPA: uroporphyrinogen decarboxylase [Cyclobacteriaceae bacterium]|nr:uroporphyrinogen decarboxylase [Cyclobacteriaceae bacterium]